MYNEMNAYKRFFSQMSNCLLILTAFALTLPENTLIIQNVCQLQEIIMQNYRMGMQLKFSLIVM